MIGWADIYVRKLFRWGRRNRPYAHQNGTRFQAKPVRCTKTATKRAHVATCLWENTNTTFIGQNKTYREMHRAGIPGKNLNYNFPTFIRDDYQYSDTDSQTQRCTTQVHFRRYFCHLCWCKAVVGETWRIRVDAGGRQLGEIVGKSCSMHASFLLLLVHGGHRWTSIGSGC